MAIRPKGTMFFRLGRYGWSETHYLADINGTLQTTLMRLRTLALRRIDMCADVTTIELIRVSFDDVFRDSFVEAVGYQTGAPIYRTQDADRPYNVVLARGESGSLYRKSIYLSGVPDSVTIDAPVSKLSSLWLSYFKPYRSQLLNWWGFKCRLKQGDNPTKLAASAVILPGVWTFNVVSHALTSGDKIQFIGGNWGGLRAPKGLISVINIVDANHFVVSLPSNYTQYLGGAQVRKLLLGVKPYSDVELIRQTHRVRGRPFDSPVGRRKRTA